MSLGPRPTSAPALQLLLLLSLLLTVLGPSAARETDSMGIERYLELRCTCVKTTSGVNLGNIQNLKVTRAGPHCSKVEVIAKLKNGKEVCLDPEAPRVRKIVQKMLKSDELAA
ncbi:PREDICTED: permeability factor 2-like [Miniopterus natalensis]|uniref:permeability factor 2-like n=1 Tax=Miniopterus natalensis TaxID=291302 RepID=UPI0007A72185|nr:PREDICTED: permeability factor 2-like [Miniopterus natalensis]